MAGCSWGSQGPAKVLTGAAHFGSGQKAMAEREVGLQGGGKIWLGGGTEEFLVNAKLGL